VEVGSVLSLRARVRAPEPERRTLVEEDLAALYAEHHEFVWRVLLNLGVATAVVEDAVQDVFLVLHRRRDELDVRGSLRGLLFGIARRVARQHRRSAARPERLRSLPELEREHPDDAVARRQAAAIVAAFLDGLDDDKRVVFVLADIEGMAMPEVADLIGIKLNTAYSRLRAARQQFRAIVSRHHGGER
jgi:RNA polymerase sigma-70 factor (ECF subfamily)